MRKSLEINIRYLSYDSLFNVSCSCSKSVAFLKKHSSHDNDKQQNSYSWIHVDGVSHFAGGQWMDGRTSNGLDEDNVKANVW